MSVLFLLAVRHFASGYYDDSFVGPVAILPVETPMAYIESAYVPTPIERLAHVNYSSCVIYAKALTGYDKSVGRASNWPVNSTKPEVNSVVIFRYSHVAVITSMSSSSFEITEANYKANQVSTRSLSFDDASIRGYYKK